jgi:hypothetical protein
MRQVKMASGGRKKKWMCKYGRERMAIPHCPYCYVEGLKYLAAKDAGAYSIIYCNQCGAIHGIVPKAQQAKVRQPASTRKPTECASGQPKREPTFLADIGYADLSGKVPYSPEKMAARMRAFGRGHGTQFMRIAVDNGPPVCMQCKVDMQSAVIPDGYPNAGQKIWVCPNYDECRRWELAESAC